MIFYFQNSYIVNLETQRKKQSDFNASCSNAAVLPAEEAWATALNLLEKGNCGARTCMDGVLAGFSDVVFGAAYGAVGGRRSSGHAGRKATGRERRRLPCRPCGLVVLSLLLVLALSLPGWTLKGGVPDWSCVGSFWPMSTLLAVLTPA